MNYRDILAKQSSSSVPQHKGRREPVEVETDIGQPTRDEAKHKEMMKMFNELPLESQLKIKMMAQKRKKAMSAEHNNKVAKQDSRNAYQEKMKSNLSFKMEQQAKKEEAARIKAENAVRNKEIKEQKAKLKAENKKIETLNKNINKLQISMEDFAKDKNLQILKEQQIEREWLEKNGRIDPATGDYKEEFKKRAKQQTQFSNQEYMQNRNALLRKKFLEAMNLFQDSDKVMEFFDKYGLSEEIQAMWQKNKK